MQSTCSPHRRTETSSLHSVLSSAIPGIRCRVPVGSANPKLKPAAPVGGLLPGCDGFIQGETPEGWTAAGAVTAAAVLWAPAVSLSPARLWNWIRILFKCSLFIELEG